MLLVRLSGEGLATLRAMPPRPQMPEVTTVQFIAIATGIFGLLAAFGLPLSQAKEDAIINLLQLTVPFLLASDAAIRVGRAIGWGRASQQPSPIVAPPSAVALVEQPGSTLAPPPRPK